MGRFNIKDKKDFEEVKTSAEIMYSNLGEVYCPYFKEKIIFNAKGFRHLKFKSDQVARVKEDQYARLKLLRFAPLIIKESRTVQGICEVKKFERQNINSRWENVLKEVTFYEFVAVVENLRIKVIVKWVEGGQKHFWSVIPYWKIDKSGGKRILHSFDREID